MKERKVLPKERLSPAEIQARKASILNPPPPKSPSAGAKTPLMKRQFSGAVIILPFAIILAAAGLACFFFGISTGKSEQVSAGISSLVFAAILFALAEMIRRSFHNSRRD